MRALVAYPGYSAMWSGSKRSRVPLDPGYWRRSLVVVGSGEGHICHRSREVGSPCLTGGHMSRTARTTEPANSLTIINKSTMLIKQSWTNKAKTVLVRVALGSWFWTFTPLEQTHPLKMMVTWILVAICLHMAHMRPYGPIWAIWRPYGGHMDPIWVSDNILRTWQTCFLD